MAGKTLRLYNEEGDIADVPEDHPNLEKYKAKFPLTEPPNEPGRRKKTEAPKKEG